MNVKVHLLKVCVLFRLELFSPNGTRRLQMNYDHIISQLGTVSNIPSYTAVVPIQTQPHYQELLPSNVFTLDVMSYDVGMMFSCSKARSHDAICSDSL